MALARLETSSELVEHMQELEAQIRNNFQFMNLANPRAVFFSFPGPYFIFRPQVSVKGWYSVLLKGPYSSWPTVKSVADPHPTSDFLFFQAGKNIQYSET